MKNALATWKWSLAVIARSPLVLLALAVVVAAWLYGAYRWLWFPSESAGYLMIIGIIWIIAQGAVVAAFLAGTETCAGNASATGADFMRTHELVGFGLRRWLHAAEFVLLASLFVLALNYLFERLHDLALEVASFLTFQSERAVAPETVDTVFWVIEAVLWIVVAGFLLSFLLALLRDSWRKSLRAAPRLLASACWRAPFLTTLGTFLVFGGLAYLLSTWHPKVSPGFSDYAQVILRQGAALLLAVVGWLFWVLSLARFTMAPVDQSESQPTSG